MKRLTNIHNFVRYRNNVFNDFLILYNLFRYNGSWKHYLKKKNLLNVTFFSKTRQLKLLKVKMMRSFFFKNLFCYTIRVSLNVKFNEYLVLVNYLRVCYSIHIVRTCRNNYFSINTNSLDVFSSVYTFISYLNLQMGKKENLFEVSNIIFKLIPTFFSFYFVVYNKIVVKSVFNNKDVNVYMKRFLQVHGSIILIELFFIQLILCIYSNLFIFFTSILFFLVNYGNISSIREGL